MNVDGTLLSHGLLDSLSQPSKNILDKFLSAIESNDIVVDEARSIDWYPSIIRKIKIPNKPDIIHRTVYMYHDVVHLMIYDPLPNVEYTQFILGKMIGEVTSQYFADYEFASCLRVLYPSYNYNARYYIKMVDRLFAINKGITAFDVIYSIAYYAIFNDRTKLINLCNGDSVAKKWCHMYMNLYRNMFSADLFWNDRNHSQFIQSKYMDIDSTSYECPLNYLNSGSNGMDELIRDIITHNISLVHSKDVYRVNELPSLFKNEDGRLYDHIKVSYTKKRSTSSIALKLRNSFVH